MANLNLGNSSYRVIKIGNALGILLTRLAREYIWICRFLYRRADKAQLIVISMHRYSRRYNFAPNVFLSSLITWRTDVKDWLLITEQHLNQARRYLPPRRVYMHLTFCPDRFERHASRGTCSRVMSGMLSTDSRAENSSSSSSLVYRIHVPYIFSTRKRLLLKSSLLCNAFPSAEGVGSIIRVDVLLCKRRCTETIDLISEINRSDQLRAWS